MAIDTEDKRMSMLSWHGGRKIPQPDGTIDQNDRQTLQNRYGGILWSVSVGGGGGYLGNVGGFISNFGKLGIRG